MLAQRATARPSLFGGRLAVTFQTGVQADAGTSVQVNASPAFTRTLVLAFTRTLMDGPPVMRTVRSGIKGPQITLILMSVICVICGHLKNL
jgi:hypothetical protein